MLAAKVLASLRIVGRQCDKYQTHLEHASTHTPNSCILIALKKQKAIKAGNGAFKALSHYDVYM